MNDSGPATGPTLDRALRAAYDALRSVVPDRNHPPSTERELPFIVDDLEDLVRSSREVAAASIGPTFWWRATEMSQADLWAPVILQLDLDAGIEDEPRGVSRFGDWEGSALHLAALAYRRECGWDHTPDESGIWLVYVSPYSATGSGQHLTWRGTVTAFVILQDRDDDGEYESLAHAWTASRSRRRGVAKRLVQHARDRFPIRQAEGPATDDGYRLLESCALDLL